MYLLIIEENMGIEGFENLAFFDSAEKKDFINADVPGAKSTDDSFVGRRISGRDQSSPDRHFIFRKLLLQQGNGFMAMFLP